MIKQYPNTINLTTNADSVQDSDGNWTPGSATTIEKSCRAEPNGGNGYVTATDGKRINFSWTVYLPLPQDKIKEGTTVTVFDGVEQIASDKVLRFSRGQIGVRIWL